MNIFKKAAACLAAAAVMTSVTMTASAEYIVARADHTSGAPGLAILGFPTKLNTYGIVSGTVYFSNSNEQCDYFLMFTIIKNQNKVSCKVMRNNNGTYENVENGEVPLFQWGAVGEYGEGIMIAFSEDSGWFEKFSEYDSVGLQINGATVRNDQPAFDYFSSTNETVDENYIEWTPINWELSGDNSESSEPTSEPASSNTSGYVEPEVSEPVSSEPVNEPASSEPVSEPASSETSSSSTNVDTGVTGIAAIVGTALLAAGAVIVSRKK